MKDGTQTSGVKIRSSEVVINDGSADIDFRVESNGNASMIHVNADDDFVGIGESAPNVTLHVTGPAGQIAIDSTSGGEPLLRFRESGSTRSLIKSDGSNNIEFHTGPDGSATERMTLGVDGALTLGQTSTSAPGSGNTTVGISLRGAVGDAFFSRADGTAGSFNVNQDDNVVNLLRSGSAVGGINVTTSGATYNTTSDIRYKQDIEPLEATDKLMAMNPVSFAWKVDPDGPRSMGFIAQEMIEVMPEAVSTETNEEARMSMDYGRITPVLVSALQDAHKKIEELESRIAAMESK